MKQTTSRREETVHTSWGGGGADEKYTLLRPQRLLHGVRTAPPASTVLTFKVPPGVSVQAAKNEDHRHSGWLWETHTNSKCVAAWMSMNIFPWKKKAQRGFKKQTKSYRGFGKGKKNFTVLAFDTEDLHFLLDNFCC